MMKIIRMRREVVLHTFYILSSIFFLAGCSSSDDIRDDVRLHEKRLINLETKYEFQQNLISRLSETIQKLAREVKSLQLSITSLQGMYVELEKKVLSREEASIQSKRDMFESKLPDLHQDLTSLRATMEDIDKQIEAIANKYEKEAEQLLPYLLIEIKQNITDWDYVKKLKKLIIALPSAKLALGIRSNINDGILRPILIDIVAEKQDYELSKALEELVLEVSDELRTQLGYALIRCKNEKGVVLLLESLSSEVENDRLYALSALKTLTDGNAMDYNPYLSAKYNENAIKKWRDWYESNRGKVFKVANSE